MIVPAIVGGSAAFMMAVELLRPGRRWPQVGGWWLRALLLNSVQVAMVFVGGTLWEPWLATHRIWSADSLGPFWAPALGYFVITFVYYWWHRARHEIPVLWRWVHQIHHSPQRLEILTSFYKHPFEIALNSILSAAILYLLVGLNPVHASYAVLMTGLAELVYHWNVKTPQWLGYFFQRPEMHCAHHGRMRLTCNYGDLPLWDILFGTFSNPREFHGQCGFENDGEQELVKMLAGVEVRW